MLNPKQAIVLLWTLYVLIVAVLVPIMAAPYQTASREFKAPQSLPMWGAPRDQEDPYSLARLPNPLTLRPPFYCGPKPGQAGD